MTTKQSNAYAAQSCQHLVIVGSLSVGFPTIVCNGKVPEQGVLMDLIREC